jgi:secreted trypsin-like serine protease
MRRKIAILCLLAATLAAVLAPIACGNGHEQPGTASGAIINGTPEANPQGSNYVQVFAAVTTIGGSFSSGALLDSTTILTCGHCLDKSKCPPSPPAAVGNVLRSCDFKPKSHVTKRANGAAASPYLGS